MYKLMLWESSSSNSIITKAYTHKKKINSSTVSAKQEVLSKLNAHFLVRAGTINIMDVILSCRTTVRLCEIIFKTKDKKGIWIHTFCVHVERFEVCCIGWIKSWNFIKYWQFKPPPQKKSKSYDISKKFELICNFPRSAL